MSTLVKVSTKEVPLVKKLFSAYRKRSVNIIATTQVRFHGLNWDGGSKSVYAAVDLYGEQARDFSHWGVPAPWDNKHEGQSVTLIPGFAVAQTGWFCGKESTLTLYVHPDDMPKYLPAA